MWEWVWHFKAWKEEGVCSVSSTTSSSGVHLLSVLTPPPTRHLVHGKELCVRTLSSGAIPSLHCRDTDMLQGLGKYQWDVSDRSVEVKCSRWLPLSRNTCSTSDGIVLSGHSYLQNNALQSKEWFSL